MHAYLKELEVGPEHPDTKLFKKVNEGILDTSNIDVQKYLTKRYQVVKGKRTQSTY